MKISFKKKIKIILVSLSIAAFAAAVGIAAAYPNKYISDVEKAAKEFSLSPSLVRAVVWTESRFDPKAVSNKGAMGLMQLMPNTFKFVSESIDVKNPYGVRDNLRAGCYYLKSLIDEFNNTDLALMAYNAGPSYIKSKLDSLDSVYPETKNYLKSVKKAYRFYSVVS